MCKWKNCTETRTDIDVELYSELRKIIHMEDLGRKYQCIYIILDAIERLRTKDIVVPLNEEEFYADYGITFRDGQIIDCGNTDINIWENKLIKHYGATLGIGNKTKTTIEALENDISYRNEESYV